MIDLLVKSITYEVPDVVTIDLRATAGAVLPPFAAGAHIDLALPSGIERSYSLVNVADPCPRYVIGVQRDRASRGGSRFLHDDLRVGAILRARPPDNNFPLVEDAAASVLIAGGIGITPLWSMAQRLARLGRSWTLFYAVRSRPNAAFLDRIRALAAGAPECLHLHADDENGGRLLDIAAIVAARPPAAHIYGCGPLPFLAAFEAATAGCEPDHIHTEYFTPKEAPARGGGFSVVLAKSARTLFVPAGRTILDTLIDNGVPAAHSCLEGVCGTCETRVIDGIPDHRDSVLSEAERATNATMMICCSGCKGDRLVLDL